MSPSTAAAPGVRRRRSSVLLVDAARRVLLFRGCDPTGEDPARSWWWTPGGGVGAGEDYAAAAVRELAEETGLRVGAGELGEALEERHYTFRYGRRDIEQTERFFLVRVEAHEVDTAGFDEAERRAVLGHRWWPLAELAATTDEVAPVDLAGLLDRALAGSP